MSSGTISETAADAATAVLSSPSIVSGTACLYMTRSYIRNMLDHDVVIAPVNPWMHTTEDVMTATTWQLTGGDFDLRTGTGTMVFDGHFVITNVKTSTSMVLWDITVNLATHTFDFTWRTPDGDMPITGLDLVGGGEGAVHGASGSYTVKEVYVNRDSAAALNEILTTSAFVDEGLFGAFATNYELKESAATDGVVKWGQK